MDTTLYTVSDLFAQLGLPDDGKAIDHFVAEHSPLDSHIAITEAQFWSPSQSQFLHQQFIADADWVGAIDALNLRLRG